MPPWFYRPTSTPRVSDWYFFVGFRWCHMHQTAFLTLLSSTLAVMGWVWKQLGRKAGRAFDSEQVARELRRALTDFQIL